MSQHSPTDWAEIIEIKSLLKYNTINAESAFKLEITAERSKKEPTLSTLWCSHMMMLLLVFWGKYTNQKPKLTVGGLGFRLWPLHYKKQWTFVKHWKQ